MCDPVSLAIMAGTQAASSIMQNKAAKSIEKKRAGVIRRVNEDTDRNRAIANQSLLNSIDRNSADNVVADETAAANDLTALYQKDIQTGDYLPGQGDASKAVKQSIVGEKLAGNARSMADARKQAVLDAYGEALLGRKIATNKNAQDIAQIGDYSMGRTNVGQIELASPKVNSSKWSDIAGLTQALGTGAGMAYNSGWFNTPAQDYVVPSGNSFAAKNKLAYSNY